jgi:type I pantothenate kinase
MALFRYLNFDTREWARLRAQTPLTLSEEELARLRGINENVSLAEVTEVYLPVSRLLNLYVVASQAEHAVIDTFLGSPVTKIPYIIGVAGSVAVGKSTTSRVLQALLARWPNHPKVDLITTDGFLFPNRVLEERGLTERKGFPESYDLRRLIQFLADVKSGAGAVTAPVYSHLVYDILPSDVQTVNRPDIVIVEGLNVLQTTATRSQSAAHVFVADFFDFSIYVDAEEASIESWYIDRFLKLRETRFRDVNSYFHRYAALSDGEAVVRAREIWQQINGVNLRENILPTRDRAHLILEKALDHTVRSVRLRKV